MAFFKWFFNRLRHAMETVMGEGDGIAWRPRFFFGSVAAPNTQTVDVPARPSNIQKGI